MRRALIFFQPPLSSFAILADPSNKLNTLHGAARLLIVYTLHFFRDQQNLIFKYIYTNI